MERTKFGEKSPMTSAADMTALTRATATAWVEREQRRTGSRMVAYDNVAESIGASASWLRKFVTGHAEVKEPSWSVGWNILAAYRRVCERVEQAADVERARARALERQIDAATASAAGMVARLAEAPARRENED